MLPGDSLLFTAGLLGSTKAGDVHLNTGPGRAGRLRGAVVGAQTGYFIGRKAGPRLFHRPDSRFFKQEYVDRTGIYLDKVRAGQGGHPGPFRPRGPHPDEPPGGRGGDGRPGRSLLANLIGGAVWSIGVTLAGYYLGKTIPNVDHYLLPIIAVVVVLSLIPVASRSERRGEKRRPVQ